MSAVVRCDGCFQDITEPRWRLGLNMTDERRSYKDLAGIGFGEPASPPEYRDFHGLACLELWVRMAVAQTQEMPS